MSADRERQTAFIQDMARQLEATGIPWIGGAIVGYLCVAGEPATQAELADELGSSVAAISAMVGRLSREGTLERVLVPGQRAARYRLVPGSYLARLRTAVEGSQVLVELAERGLAMHGRADSAGKAYLSEFRDLNLALGAKITEVINEYGRRGRLRSVRR